MANTLSINSHTASISPYPSPFLPCPSPPPSPVLMSASLRTPRSHAYNQPPSRSHAHLDENGRKPEVMYESTLVASTASQNARFPSSSFQAPLSHADSLWNDAKRRKSQQVSPSAMLFVTDSHASSALSLASLSLSIHHNHTPANIDSTLLHSSPSSHAPASLSPSSIPPSPPTSPATSSLSSSRSDTPLSSSSEVPSSPPLSPPMSPPASPPSSPNMKKNKMEIRHKGKQLKSRCTCCHVCRTSLKNYPRNHLDCTACNAVVCQPCIEFRQKCDVYPLSPTKRGGSSTKVGFSTGPTWEVASREPNWLCPACLGTCVCQRCSSRPLEIASKSQFTRKGKSENNHAEARQQRLEELMEYHRERDKFIHEIQNVLAIVKRDQREIEYQIAALQCQGDEEEDEQ